MIALNLYLNGKIIYHIMELIGLYLLLFFQSRYTDHKKYNQIAKFMEIKKAQSIQTDSSIKMDGFDHFLQLTRNLFKDLLQQHESSCSTIFNCQSLYSIDLDAYIRKIHSFTKFSQQCLLIAIIYLDRYNLANENFHLNRMNIHRIYLTCLILATKFQDDIYYDNKSFELAGGVSSEDLLQYELQISNCLDFNFFVSTSQYKKLANKLEEVYITID